MRRTINPADFDRTGTIQTSTPTRANGEAVPSWANTYTSVKSKQLTPLRFNEGIESKQQVGVETHSWLIRKEARVIVANKMKYVVDSKDYHIVGVRDYVGGRLYYVLDTEYRDNQ